MLIGAFDVETIPSQTLPKECRPRFDPDTVKLPGNPKDPFKIEAGMAKAKKKFDESLNKKMATDPALCQVCTFVGYFYDINKSEVKDKKIFQYKSPEEDAVEEDGVVWEAWNFIKHCYNSNVPLVSFNGKHFDLPVLFYRAMLLGTPVEQTMYKLFTDKWNVTKYHYDLMQILVGGPYPQRDKNFDFHLRLFNIGEKTLDMDGSKVYEKWLNDEHDVIKQYCEDDVLSTCKLFSRVSPWVILHE